MHSPSPLLSPIPTRPPHLNCREDEHDDGGDIEGYLEQWEDVHDDSEDDEGNLEPWGR